MKLCKKASGDSKADRGTGTVLSKKSLMLISGAMIIILTGCGSSAEEHSSSREEKAVADSVSSYVGAIATETINGVTHNFIRKAEMKFKVKDVLKSSNIVEDLTTASGGYISSSEMSSSQHYSNTTRISKDSVLEQIYYTTVNRISLRVPNQKLDTVLRQISDLALFIDYRHLSSDDVKMKFFSNKLAEARYNTYKNKVTQKTNSVTAKQDQIVNTEENLLNKQTLADQKRIETIELADQVNYSTVSVEIYQPSSCLKQYLAAEEKLEPYEPSFFEKAGEAFISGFAILKSFFLMLINIWGLILIFGLAFWGLRKWRGKKV